MQEKEISPTMKDKELKKIIQRINEKAEEEYYEIIKEKFEDFFKEKFEDVYFEITASGNFSNRLKGKINKDIIFIFLKKAASPDITGLVDNIKEEYKTKYYPSFVVIEVKKEEIKLDDIYQTRKYAELFDAKYAFLVSLKQIPEIMKRLSNVRSRLLSLPAYQTLTLVHFNENTNEFEGWYPKEPMK